MQRAREIVHTPGEAWMPNWLVSIGFVRGAVPRLAEVLVFKGMGVSDVGTSARDEVMALVGGVGVIMFKRPEGELGAWNRIVWEE